MTGLFSTGIADRIGVRASDNEKIGFVEYDPEFPGALPWIALDTSENLLDECETFREAVEAVEVAADGENERRWMASVNDG